MDTLTEISLFTGGGGLDLAAKKSGVRTVCRVERDLYSAASLMSRFRDGTLEDAPLWDDVTTFDGRPWRGLVDIVAGGFPCQPHSDSGHKKGELDERNLWPDFLRIVRECEPAFVIGENVSGIFDTGYALTVLADLEENGYCATPFQGFACAVGAPHPRERVFFVAHAKSIRWDAFAGPVGSSASILESSRCDLKSPWHEKISPEIYGVDDGLAYGLHRIRLCGNGVVPQTAELVYAKIKKMLKASK